MIEAPFLFETGAASDTGAIHRARPGDWVRVFDYTKASGTTALQEMATAMRTVIGSPRIFALNAGKKIIRRGGRFA